MTLKTYHTSDHDIDPSFIDPDAVYIIHKLREFGHEAYLVGGSVRDLLKGTKPKDFDISTSALPEEIKSIFKRSCLLIGRRFRLAHIRFGKKLFEVSTFRTGDTETSELIVHDNEWGTPEEDVLRRDFTINGLFYDPEEHTVIDYPGGWEDIHEGVLRTIGNPHARFNQDPVRMIRMLKFKARFDFKIDPEAQEALDANKQAIVKSSQARVLEEMLRMLESGFAETFFRLMKQYNFLELLFPWLDKCLDQEQGQVVYELLKNADTLSRSFGPIERPVMFCCLLYPLFQSEIERRFLQHDKIPHLGEVADTAFSILAAVGKSSFTHFPRRLTTSAVNILVMQYRLVPIGNRRYKKSKILESADYLDGLSLLKVRSMGDESLAECYHQWQQTPRPETTDDNPIPRRAPRRRRRTRHGQP